MRRMNSVSELKQRLVEACNSLQPYWERACVQTDNILSIYCEHVWLTKVMDK